MGSLFRGKRDAAPRYIAGVLQLFVINGIAFYSVVWGFHRLPRHIHFVFRLALQSGRKILKQFVDRRRDKNAAVREDGR